jgi:hypothetical protein
MSANKKMSGTTATSNTTAAQSMYGLGGATSNSTRAGSTHFPFKAKSAYFPSAHTEFQAAMAGAAPIPARESSDREKRASQQLSPMSPPRDTTTSSRSRPKSLSNAFNDGKEKEKDKLVVTGNGPFEPPRTFGDKFIDEKIPTWSAEKERILLGPFDYLYGHPGKDIRAQLIAAFNVWLKVPEESLTIITKVVGMLHTASLL